MDNKTITKMAFVITGEFLTDHSRNMWIEGKPDRGISTLVDGLEGITQDQAIQICTGKAKLIGDSHRGMDIVPDNETEHHGINLLTLSQMLEKQRKALENKTDEYNDLNSPGVYIASPWGLIEVPSRIKYKLADGKISWDDSFFDDYRTEYDLSGTNKDNYATKCSINDSIQENESKVETDDEEPPKPDSSLSALNAWVDRKGKFYPCQYYAKHMYVAELLGYEERQLEKLGWMKISDSKDFAAMQYEGRHDFMLGDKPATQAQKNTCYAWAEKHGRKVPDWIFEDDED